jgi:hypothetical protein
LFSIAGACLSTDIDPSDLVSVKSFDEEHQSQSSLPSELKSPQTEKNDKKSRKREFDKSDTDTDSEAIKAKKGKLENASPNKIESNARKRRNSAQVDFGNSADDADTKKRRLGSEQEESFHSALDSAVGKTSTPISKDPKSLTCTEERETKKKKKRRRNKKNGTWKEADVQLETDSIQLRILPKVCLLSSEKYPTMLYLVG